MEERLTDTLVAIRRILRAAEFSARDLARSSGLTPSQLVVLQIVAREGERGAGVVAATARLTQATVTVLLDKLAARGLIERHRYIEDRRRVAIRLTAAGATVLAATPDVLQDRFAARFARLADWEQASLLAALERTAALLEADSIDAAPILDVGSLKRQGGEQ
jgi:DNA-binding MarR family transcriptional regulator